MQGTGTQTDPYIPETWDEFVTAVGTNHAYVSLPEGGGTFNMNEIAPEGDFIVYIRCEQLNGNGWIIHAPHNVEFSGSSNERTNGLVINDLHFLEIIFEAASSHKCMFDGNKYYRLKFNRCAFSGRVDGYEGGYLFGDVDKLDQCDIEIAFVGKAHNLFGSATYGLTATSVNAKLDYSGCTYTSTETITTQSNKIIKYSFFEITNCNLDLDFQGSRSVFHFNDNGGYVRNADGEKKIVTEEQLRDAAYLNSVGYPISLRGLS